jgi:GNAT superfamily N-acetyltransferase
MFLPDGYTPLPDGKLAAVVTYLEMRTPPAPATVAGEFTLRRAVEPDPDWYRRLFRAVGEDWLWFSRLRMTDAELSAILGDPRLDLYVLEHGAREVGLLELDRRTPPDIELSFFGVTPDMVGKGAGRWLIAQAIERAWAHHPRRFWLHTCTLDHPRALSFYVKAGFTAYSRAVEVSDDPRLTGDLPRDAAPQIPLIEPRP